MKRYNFQPNKPQGSTNYVMIGGGLVLLIGVIAIFAFMIFSQQGEAKKSGIDFKDINITKNTSEVCDDECYFALGVEGNDPSSCLKVENESMRQGCYEKISSTSIEACLSLVDKEKRNSCIFAYADNTRDVEPCFGLEEKDQQESCILSADKCYYKEGLEKDLCRAVDRSDFKFCKGNQTCLLDYAFQTGDESGCSVLGTDALRVACTSISEKEDKCTTALAYQSQKDQCKEQYAVWSNLSYVCDDIDKTTVYALGCYAHFATVEKNKNYCSKLKFENAWDCYTEYALNSKDVSGCIAIHELAKFKKAGCFVNFAKDNRDPSACTYMNDSSSKINCYTASITYNATTPIPPANCANIVHEGWKDKCYTYSAIGNNNLRICDDIVGEAEKANCYSKFK